MLISRNDLYWLAGLWEGEGCFSWHSRKTNYGQPVAAISMADSDVIEKAAKLIGAKSVTTTQKLGRKPAFRACVTGNKAYQLMQALKPLMGDRRTMKITELSGKWERRPSVSAQPYVLYDETAA